MYVYVLSDHTPPSALLEAAQAYCCAGCGGFIELTEVNKTWVAQLAHAADCSGNECSVRDDRTVIVPIEDLHSPRVLAIASSI
jgi:hypothetical protein